MPAPPRGGPESHPLLQRQKCASEARMGQVAGKAATRPTCLEKRSERFRRMTLVGQLAALADIFAHFLARASTRLGTPKEEEI
jgi:hypothetical protein